MSRLGLNGSGETMQAIGYLLLLAFVLLMVVRHASRSGRTINSPV
jgi:hypothetical protein